VTDVVFMPGIIAPAAVRYAPLLAALPDVHSVLKDLEVYRDAAPPHDYSMTTEIDALGRAADESGFDRFHLYGHSGGGAIALAYAAAQPQRLLSLAVDEPALDFTDEGDRTYGWEEFDHALTLPPAEATAEFMRLQVAAGVEINAPADPPPWMANRPAGIRAFIAAARRHQITPETYRRFRAPVYFSRGSRTHPRWAVMQLRLAKLFPDFTAEVYEGLHHLHTSHQAEPARVAASLRTLWTRAESALGATGSW
jgi:pimeloyl-ACP methyl ester carboxylesterase